MYKKILTIFVFLSIALMGMTFAAPADNVDAGESPLVTTQVQGDQEKDLTQVQTQDQEQTRTRVQDGENLSEGGKLIQVRTEANNKMKFEVEGVSAESSLPFKQNYVNGETKLSVSLSNGRNAEVKVMPNTASATALEKLSMKSCSTENNCSIELKEVGKGNETKLAYELKTQRQSKVLGLFKAQMKVQAEVSAENGEVIKVKKPWWALLASEPQEE